MRVKCKGGCGKEVGTGCGCCSPDFPEQYGYCSDCYLGSDHYNEQMHVLRSLIERLDASELKLLYIFVDEYDEDYSRHYLKGIKNKMTKEEFLKNIK